jgi:glycosyltransferase involved in cell wall biosynthesis
MSHVSVTTTETGRAAALTAAMPHGRALRVLLLAPQPYFQQRGTPIAVRSLLDVLAKRGYDITVLTYPEGEDTHATGYRIERLRKVPGIARVRPGFSVSKLVLDAAMLGRAVSLYRRFRPDLVHAVEEAAFIGLAMKRLFGVPYVYDMDSSLAQQMVERYPRLAIASPVLRRLERAAVRGSVGVLAVCRSLEELAREHAPGQFIRRIEDVSLVDGGDGADEILTTTTGCNDPIVLYVGNLEPYQGVQLLLEGFRAMAANRPAQLVIIGGSTASVREHQQRIQDGALDARIHFLGPRPLSSLGWYLRQADVVASPRTTGTNTPMKIYSYLDSGTAVLATRLPTHTQVLDDSVACLVEPNPAAVAAGLDRLLSDSALRADLARNAGALVKREFSREAFERKVNAFYDGLEARVLTPEPSPT